MNPTTKPEPTAGPTRDEIQHLLAGVAQAAVNIREGLTKIEDGSRVFLAFEGLCEPRIANLLLAVPELVAALREASETIKRIIVKTDTLQAEPHKVLAQIRLLARDADVKARAALAKSEGKEG